MTQPQTRWLTADEQAIWRLFLEVGQGVWAALDRDVQEYANICLAEYEVLAHLSEADNWRLRMSDLAKRACQSPSRLTHNVGRLQKQGWVTREPTRHDRRGVTCVLTQHGWEALQQIAPVHVASVHKRLVEPMTAEQLAHFGAVLRTWRPGPDLKIAESLGLPPFVHPNPPPEASAGEAG